MDVSLDGKRQGSYHHEVRGESRATINSNLRGCSMGDKSPKSKERQKKQDTSHKNQKKAAALVKATPAPAKPRQGGK